MRIRPAMGAGAKVFGARFSNMNEAVKGFLSDNPLVFINGQKLTGLTFLDSTTEHLPRFQDIPGLSNLIVVTRGSNLLDGGTGNRE